MSRILRVERKTLAQRLKSDRYFAWIKRQVTPKEAAEVAALNLRGLQLTKEAKRYYPNRELASHLIGFTNLDGTGISGLELQYDSRLRGSDQRVPAVRDRRGNVVYSEELVDDRSSLGDSITLTIDKTIQHIAERELALAVKTYEAKSASVVVLDPSSGQVLAVANYPTFNPNEPNSVKSDSRRNRALTDLFEPGSTIKPMTIAGALKANVLGPYQAIDCENGTYRVATSIIHDTKKHGLLSPTEVLSYSSNIGVAKIAEALGKKRLYETLRGFGFGEKTHVGFPGESSGRLRDYHSWYQIDTANVAFGQGLSVTSLQLATAMGAIANGGVLVRPTLVARITDGFERVVDVEQSDEIRRVLPQESAELVRDMLTAVTGPSGTGTEAAVDGYLTAGKTGTAQKADPIVGGYAKDKWVSSFVGFLPADDPRVVISVVVDEPMIEHYGGAVAGPVFRRIGAGVMRHLGVPGRDSIIQIVKAESNVAVDTSTEAAIAVSEEHTANPRGGNQKFQKMPNLVGKTMREAIKALHDRSLVARVEGSGLVVSQQFVAGKNVNRGASVRLVFGRPDALPPIEESRKDALVASQQILEAKK
ncbi:MAG: penicillin-binding protein [Polyangiales bacterium]